MPIYNFSLVITPPAVDEGEAADKPYDCGCDDSTFSACGFVCEVEFSREAFSLRQALIGAIGDVEKSRIGSRVVRILFHDP